MDAQFLDGRDAPTLLPLGWIRRLAQALDREAREGAEDTLVQLDAALHAFTERALDRDGCRAFLREHGALLRRYFSLVSALVAKFGAPVPDAIRDEWSEASEGLVPDEGSREALRRAMDRVIEVDAAFSGPHRPELLAALDAERAAFAGGSPLQRFLSAWVELIVAMLAGTAVPSGGEPRHARLLAELCAAYDAEQQASLRQLFARLGRWKSPSLPAPHERALWHLFGAAGVRFLLENLADEHDGDRLDAAGEVIVALWPVSAGAVRTTLNALLSHGGGDELLLTLLRSLRWVRRDARMYPMERALLVGLLHESLAHRDPDVREAAARALAAWQGNEAAEVLRRRVPFERDADVSDVLLELLAEVTEESAA